MKTDRRNRLNRIGQAEPVRKTQPDNQSDNLKTRKGTTP